MDVKVFHKGKFPIKEFSRGSVDMNPNGTRLNVLRLIISLSIILCIPDVCEVTPIFEIIIMIHAV